VLQRSEQLLHAFADAILMTLHCLLVNALCQPTPGIVTCFLQGNASIAGISAMCAAQQ
jgi:hypothetical protein